MKQDNKPSTEFCESHYAITESKGIHLAVLEQK